MKIGSQRNLTDSETYFEYAMPLSAEFMKNTNRAVSKVPQDKGKHFVEVINCTNVLQFLSFFSVKDRLQEKSVASTMH